MNFIDLDLNKIRDWNVEKSFTIYYDKIFVEQLYSFTIIKSEIGGKIFMKNIVPIEGDDYLIYFTSSDNISTYERIKNNFTSSLLVIYNSPSDLIRKTLEIIKAIKKSELDFNYDKMLFDIQRGIGFLTSLKPTIFPNDAMFFYTLFFFIEKLLNLKSYNKFVYMVDLVVEYIQIYYFGEVEGIMLLDKFIIVIYDNIMFPMSKGIYTIFNKKYDCYIFTYKYSKFIFMSDEMYNYMVNKYEDFESIISRKANKVYNNEGYFVIVDNEKNEIVEYIFSHSKGVFK